jgi:hypothetical protein
VGVLLELTVPHCQLRLLLHSPHRPGHCHVIYHHTAGQLMSTPGKVQVLGACIRDTCRAMQGMFTDPPFNAFWRGTHQLFRMSVDIAAAQVHAPLQTTKHPHVSPRVKSSPHSASQGRRVLKAVLNTGAHLAEVLRSVVAVGGLGVQAVEQVVLVTGITGVSWTCWCTSQNCGPWVPWPQPSVLVSGIATLLHTHS